MVLENAVGKNGIDEHRGDERYDVQDSDLAQPEAERRQRAQDQCGAEQGAGLSASGAPSVGSIIEIPGAQGIEQKHPRHGEREGHQPKQGSRVARTQIKDAKRRKQKRGQDERWNLVPIVHKDAKVEAVRALEYTGTEPEMPL